MLTRTRNRKGWVRAGFFVRAALFAASFSIGGVGTGSNASLSDIIGQNNGSASTTSTAGIGTANLSTLKDGSPFSAF